LRALLKEIPYSGIITFHCGHDHRSPTPEHIGLRPAKAPHRRNLPLTVRDLLAMALQRRPLFLGIASPCASKSGSCWKWSALRRCCSTGPGQDLRR